MAANSNVAGGASPGGIAANHAGRVVLPVMVGTSTAQEFNTLRPPLLPIACWRLEDLRFDFDSSFVKPEAAVEFAGLAVLWNRTGKPPMSIFGHADPVGNDDYNKTLSGRRATAIYALLTRNTSMWESLYSQPFQGDNWGVRSEQRMLAALGHDPGPADGQSGPQTSDAVKDFQAAHGLAVDGVAGPQTRSQLFQAYMDALAPGFQLAAADFLARGQDPDGKGDFQGCSEFNPVLVFSGDEQNQFGEPGRKLERNAANAPNRRVVAFLFAPGTKVNSEEWPCPRAKEGVAACRAMLWPDGDVRRNPQAKRREYERDRNTFACRFYDGMARRSPCEIVRKNLRIRLFDPGKDPIPNAPYRLSILATGEVRESTAGPDGVLVEADVVVPGRCQLQWGDPRLKQNPLPLSYQVMLFLDVDSDDDDEASFRRRLNNLGYTESEFLADSVRAFQRDYGISETGDLNDPTTREAIRHAASRGASKTEIAAGQ